MHHPKTHLEDYKNWHIEKIELLSQWSKGKLSRAEYEANSDLLEDRFKEKIYQEDFRYFNNVRNLKKHLDGVSDWQNKKTIEHEMEHERRALEKGYKYKCGLCYLIDEINVFDFDVITRSFSLVESKDSNPIPVTDLIYIYSVDKNPTWTDAIMVNALRYS